jgi:uncharacterized protein (TIGR02186 family)
MESSMKAVIWIPLNRISYLVAMGLLAALTPALGIESAGPQEKVGEVITGTTKSTVNIGLMYNGDYIYFFGTIPDPSADVIVKLTSIEEETLVVNRKGKVALLWMNVKRFNIGGLPLLYKVHSTKPINQIVSPTLARELGIGYDVLKEGMRLEPVRGQVGPDDRDVVFDGIMRLKREANLYNIDEKRVEITSGRLFKHYFRFPPAAKEGTYRAESYIIKDLKLIGRGVDEVVIHKGGIESAFSRTAYGHPVIYGIVSVVVALGMGLLVGFLFKKGGGH